MSERKSTAFGSSTDSEVTQRWSSDWRPTSAVRSSTWKKLTGQAETAEVSTRVLDSAVVGVLLPQQVGGPPPAEWAPAPLVVPRAGAEPRTYEGSSTGTYETYGHRMRATLSWRVDDRGPAPDDRCDDARELERTWTADVEEDGGTSRGSITSTSTEVWCGAALLVEATGVEEITSTMQASSRSWTLRRIEPS